MGTDKSRTISVSSTSIDSPEIENIGYKRMKLECPKTNTANVYVAFTYESGDENPKGKIYRFVTIAPGDCKFKGAPEQQKIWYIYFYQAIAGQILSYEASDGSMDNLYPNDPTNLASVFNIVKGYTFTERWEQGYYDRRKFFGRTGAPFKSDGNVKDQNLWHIPAFASAVNTLEVAPFNNAIQMVNSVDGITKDELYFFLPQAYSRARMRFDVKLPTVAQIPAADDGIMMGLEAVAQGGANIVGLLGNAGTYYLEAKTMNASGVPVETVVSADISGSLTLNAFYSLWLDLDPPFLTLSHGTTVISKIKFYGQPGYYVPFFCNESVTTLVSNFYLGQWSIWSTIDEGSHRLQDHYASYTTANAWATVVEALLPRFNNQMLIHLKELNTNAIQIRITGSLDGTNYETLQPATVMLQNGSAAYPFSNAWLYIKIEAIDNVAGTHGKLKVEIGGS